MASELGLPARILVVEDDSTDRVAMVELLTSAGYSALGSPSAIEGMRAALSMRPHVVILDLVLPDFSGTELARAFLATTVTRSTCVIVVTGSPQLVSFVDPTSFGAAEVLVKPILPALLLAAVEKCLAPSPSAGFDARDADGEPEIAS